MRSALFDTSLREKEVPDRWSLQSPKMLRTVLGPEVIATKGAMVAYQGEIVFEHEKSGSFGRLMKKVLTSEDAPMMRVRGRGEVFFARQNRDIFMIQLENDGITVNSSSLLGFDASVNWDIRRVQGGGMMSGGFFNLVLEGQGMVAIVSDGPPALLDCSVQPTFVDPQAAIAWSSNLVPGVKNSMNMRSMLRGGSGEAFQLAFHGPGFVLVQPSEGTPFAPTASGSSGGGIGNLFN